MNPGTLWQLAGGAAELVGVLLAILEIRQGVARLRSYRTDGDLAIHAPVIDGEIHAVAPAATGGIPTAPETDAERLEAIERALDAVRTATADDTRKAEQRAEQMARHLTSQVEAIAAAELRKVEDFLVDVATVDVKAKVSAGLLLLGLAMQMFGTWLGVSAPGA